MHHTTKNKFLILLFIFCIFSSYNSLFAQEKKIKITCIAFYNTENFYDTIKSPDTDDAEFLPSSSTSWNTEKYMIKLDHLSEVISQIGDEQVKGGPAIIGLSEVENRGVLQDLINTPRLKKLGYAIVHYDSPDRRGVD
ncbi:MAG: endonuclease/exonuclease/phosphatase family protein, partial [Bacteroidota bacterium]